MYYSNKDEKYVFTYLICDYITFRDCKIIPHFRHFVPILIPTLQIMYVHIIHLSVDIGIIA